MLLSPYEALWDLQECGLDPAFVYTLRARYANPLSLSYWDIKTCSNSKWGDVIFLRKRLQATDTPASQSNFSKAITHELTLS